MVLLILGCFSVCWLPYFVVACAQIFQIMEKSSPTLYKAAFSLAIGNSCMNPIIYAWKNTAFRLAFGRLLHCKSPDFNDFTIHISRTHRRSSTIIRDDSTNDENGSSTRRNTAPDTTVVIFGQTNMFQLNENTNVKMNDDQIITLTELFNENCFELQTQRSCASNEPHTISHKQQIKETIPCPPKVVTGIINHLKHSVENYKNHMICQIDINKLSSNSVAFADAKNVVVVQPTTINTTTNDSKILCDV